MATAEEGGDAGLGRFWLGVGIAVLALTPAVLVRLTGVSLGPVLSAGLFGLLSSLLGSCSPGALKVPKGRSHPV